MYSGALADMNLSADPFTGSRYAFGNGNPVSNIELDGHLAVDAGGGISAPPVCLLLCIAGSPGTSGSGGPSITCTFIELFCPAPAPVVAPHSIPGGTRTGGGTINWDLVAAVAAAAAAAALIFRQQRSQDCLQGGPAWQAYGPEDTAVNPGRATWAAACIVPPLVPGTDNPAGLPGYDRTTMDLSHLLGRRFGGSAAPANIVLLWRTANQSNMKAWENRIASLVNNSGEHILYYAQAIYAPVPSPSTLGNAYMPEAIFMTWQVPLGISQSATVLNIP
jgi:hypothetical protein